MDDNQNQAMPPSADYQQNFIPPSDDDLPIEATQAVHGVQETREMPKSQTFLSGLSEEQTPSESAGFGQPQDAPTVPLPVADIQPAWAGGAPGYGAEANAPAGLYAAGTYGRQPMGDGQSAAQQASSGQIPPQQPYAPGAFAQSPYGQPQQGHPGFGQGYAVPAQDPYRYVQPNQPWNVLTIIGFVFAFINPLVGLIFSIIALVMVRKSGEKSRGLAIAGIVIGAINLVVMIIAVCVFASALSQIASDYGSGAGQSDGSMMCIDGQCQSLPGIGSNGGGASGSLPGGDADGADGNGSTDDGGILGDGGEDWDDYSGLLGGDAAVADPVAVHVSGLGVSVVTASAAVATEDA